MKNLIAITVLFITASFFFNADTFAQDDYSQFKVVIKVEMCSGSGGVCNVQVFDAGTQNLVAGGESNTQGIWFALGGPQIYHYYDVIVEKDENGQRGEARNVYFPFAGVQVDICLGAPSK
jgi:hypothetical protein